MCSAPWGPLSCPVSSAALPNGHCEAVMAGSLGHYRALVKACFAPFLAFEHRLQLLDCMPYVDMARIQGRKAQPQDVGSAKVADDPAGDQGLGDGVCAFVPCQAYLAASHGWVARSDQLQAVAGAVCFDQINEQGAERQRFFPQGTKATQGFGGQYSVHAT